MYEKYMLPIKSNIVLITVIIDIQIQHNLKYDLI